MASLHHSARREGRVPNSGGAESDVGSDLILTCAAACIEASRVCYSSATQSHTLGAMVDHGGETYT